MRFHGLVNGKSASGAIAHGVYLLAPKRWSVEMRRLLSSVAVTLTFIFVATSQLKRMERSGLSSWSNRAIISATVCAIGRGKPWRSVTLHR